jgi:biotin carboxyl carrier protein
LEFRITLRDRVETIVHKLGLKLEADGRVNEISAPMPGLVLKLLVSEGQSVSKGDPLVILEAMKMENVLAAPNDAEIDTVSVQQGDTVDKGQLLIKLI